MSQIARSAVLIGFTSLCRQWALNPHELLCDSGLDPLLLRREDLYLPYARFAELLNRLAYRSGCGSVGLRLSHHHDYFIFGPFGLLLSQAESLAVVLQLAQQFVHLHAQGIRLEAHEQGEQLFVEYQLQLDSVVDLRQLLELGMGVVQHTMQSLFQAQWQPQQVCFAHACMGNEEEYRAAFACPVMFAQGRSGFYVSRDALTLKPVEQRRELTDFLLRRISQQTAQVASSAAQQVTVVLQSILSTGEVTLPVVARLLACHPRSLQQALQREGVSFRQLLAQVRFREAQQQLQLSTQSLTELALNLGYADETAFSRAFKRWSGMAPQLWRATEDQGSTA